MVPSGSSIFASLACMSFIHLCLDRPMPSGSQHKGRTAGHELMIRPRCFQWCRFPIPYCLDSRNVDAVLVVMGAVCAPYRAHNSASENWNYFNKKQEWKKDTVGFDPWIVCFPSLLPHPWDTHDCKSMGLLLLTKFSMFLEAHATMKTLFIIFYKNPQIIKLPTCYYDLI